MKNTILASIALAGLLTAGCKTTPNLLTPAALTSEVALGVRVGLDVYPEAAPGVALSRDVVCTAAANTNVTPAAIVADLQAMNVTNTNVKLIVDAAVLLYEGVFDLIGTNAPPEIQAYTTALCNGLTQRLPPVAGARTMMATKPQILPPHWR